MDNFKKFLTHYKPGEIIFNRGDLQSDFFIINSGKIQLRGEKNLVLVTLTKGDFFGEESLNSDQPALYGAEVVEAADLIKLSYPTLVDMIKQNSEIALKVLKKLSEKHQRIQEATLSLLANQPEVQREAAPAKAEARVNERTSEKIDPSINAYLIIQRSNRVVQITNKLTFLGRRDYTSGFVPDVDLTDEDEEKYISRKHALITFNDGKFYFSEEPGAINGTFLNGNKLTTGVKYDLHNEDELTLCHLNIIFKY